jgi:hypothetical protein
MQPVSLGSKISSFDIHYGRRNDGNYIEIRFDILHKFLASPFQLHANPIKAPKITLSEQYK